MCRRCPDTPTTTPRIARNLSGHLFHRRQPRQLQSRACRPDGTPTIHCDLASTDPGANPGDARGAAGIRRPARLPPAQHGHLAVHAASLRLPHSHGSHRDHQVCGEPVHRLLGASDRTRRSPPNLLDFFDFNNVPWETPPTPPTPYSDPSGASSCTPTSMGP